MQYLGLLFTLAILAVNLWGLMLIAGVYWRNRWFALALAPLLAVTAVYAVECHHGLGRSLSILGITGTALSVALIGLSLSAWEPGRLGERARLLLREWRGEFAPRRLAGCLGVGTAIFLYALLWRFNHPDLDGTSEKIADLSYICSYLTGATIPVPDVWFSPYPSTQYYSFQHYGAALMGRVLLLSPGTTYNLGFCVLIALAGTAFAGAVCLAARKLWVRALLIAGFIFGGTGMSVLVHRTDNYVQPTIAWRFIGSAQMDRPPLGPLLKAYNKKFVVHDPEGGAHMMELPAEPFAYSIFLGDYHAPLSGYYLMAVGAMSMMLWARFRQLRYPVIAGCTLTWTLLSNTWVLPLQGLAVFGWLAFNWRDWRRLVPAVAFGAAAVWLVAWVYLSAFTASAAGYNTAIKLVPWEMHTPPLLFLLLMLPTVALVVLGFASGVPQGRRLAALWLAFLLFSEFVYVRDEYSGQFARFNTTLKWWPWVMAGTLMTLGPFVLEQARRRWVRVAGLLFCLYPCFYFLDLWDSLWSHAPDTQGKLDGSYFLTKDQFPRMMLERLRLEKPGVVVERPDEQGGFTSSAVLPLLAGQRMWLGWWGHELLWRGNREDVRRRHDLLMQFYAGDNPDAGRWLAAQGIDYILWYRLADTTDLWPKINKAVSPEYIWCDILTYQDEDGRRVGFWRRAPGAVP